MGNPKQTVISRFFAPKSQHQHQPPSPSSPPPPPQNHPKSSPKITATATFSPSKRTRAKSLSSTPPLPSKKPKPSPTPTSSPSLHQKFVSKLLSPVETTSIPLSPSPSPSNPKKYTPLEQQVLALKSAHPCTLLMVEVGYRYRFFGADAEAAAKVLGIFAHMDHNFLTASVPTFRLNFHVRRLVAAGYKVGVVRQTETAAIKSHGDNRLGPFSRGLSAVYTKATIEAAEEMEGGGGGESEGSNYLVCVVERELVGEKGGREGFEVKVGVVAVEVSTGEVVHGEFNDDASRSGLEAILMSLSPVEVLMAMPLSFATEKVVHFVLVELFSEYSSFLVELTHERARNC